MKKYFPIFAALLITCGQPSEAGVIHRLARIAGKPMWIAGFTVKMVTDFLVLPFKEGVEYFDTQPFVSF
jgi:hypothetical protein